MRFALLVILFSFTLHAEPPLVVHVTVALCDNATQGIVPVPRAIGDGNDPRTNLYWGASHGVKSWLKREKWERTTVPAQRPILERIIAKKTVGNRQVILIADAWQGSAIRSAITVFLEHAAGLRHETVNGVKAGGAADVVAYIGHDGLMEFSVAPRVAARGATPKSIVLACASRAYFSPHLERARSEPILLTNGLMAPEAYTLTAAIDAWTRKKEKAAVVEAAAQAYHKYQNCGIRAARRLFR